MGDSEYFEITCPKCEQQVKMFPNEQIEEHNLPTREGDEPVLCGASNQFAAAKFVSR